MPMQMPATGPIILYDAESISVNSSFTWLTEDEAKQILASAKVSGDVVDLCSHEECENEEMETLPISDAKFHEDESQV